MRLASRILKEHEKIYKAHMNDVFKERNITICHSKKSNKDHNYGTKVNNLYDFLLALRHYDILKMKLFDVQNEATL